MSVIFRKTVSHGYVIYIGTFSLRDEKGTCLNIEVEIDVTDKSPFFIRPYHVKEEDKNILDRDMKRLCYLGILREGFSAYSSPAKLISRKVMKDKRVVTEFRYLNMRIPKNNLTNPLLKRYIFSVRKLYMGGIISLQFKGCFPFSKAFGKLKKILWNLTIFW